MNHPVADSPRPAARSDRGIALIVAMLIMVLLSALGLSLTMVTATEERVAHSYSSASESFYAADAALELAVSERVAPGEPAAGAELGSHGFRDLRANDVLVDRHGRTEGGSALGTEQPSMAAVCLWTAVGHESVGLDRLGRVRGRMGGRRPAGKRR